MNEEYWKDAFIHRMDSYWEVDRLEMVLKGYLYDHNRYAEETNQPSEIMTPLEFWDSKRPYGNKNIALSIVYNLGWDNKRVLMKEDAPEWVKETAMRLHDLVKIELEKQVE